MDYINPMTGFTKLWSMIVNSTIWRDEMHVKVVWVTMLAMADRDGYVTSSLPGLADVARVPLDQTIDALQRLSSPDPYSRTKDHEGRRIEEVEGGWHILNYLKYRNLKSQEERRLQVREAVARYREKKADTITVIKSKPIADAEAESRSIPIQRQRRRGAPRPPFVKPTVEEVRDYIQEKNYHFTPEEWMDHYIANGWKVGKNPMADWKAAVRQWETHRKQGQFGHTSKYESPARGERLGRGGMNLPPESDLVTTRKKEE